MTQIYDIFLSTLLSLGLSEIEAKLYITCQNYGASPISSLAKHLGIPRTTVYNYVGNLLKKQILIESKNMKGTLYSAQPPDMIISLLRQQQKKINSMITDIESIKDTLVALEQEKVMPKIRYYQGKEAILATYDKYSKSKNGFAYFDVAIVCQTLQWTPEQTAKIFEKITGDFREIIVQNEEGEIYNNSIKNKNHHIKMISLQGGKTFLTDTICCDGIIHYICYDNSNLVIEIQHTGLYQTQQVFFDQLRGNIT